MVHVGIALGRLREKLGLSQSAFGKPAGVKHQQVSRYETATEIPRFDTVLRLLAGQGLSLRDLEDEIDAVRYPKGKGQPSPTLESRLDALERIVLHEAQATDQDVDVVLERAIAAQLDYLEARIRGGSAGARRRPRRAPAS